MLTELLGERPSDLPSVMWSPPPPFAGGGGHVNVQGEPPPPGEMDLVQKPPSEITGLAVGSLSFKLVSIFFFFYMHSSVAPFLGPILL